MTIGISLFSFQVLRLGQALGQPEDGSNNLTAR